MENISITVRVPAVNATYDFLVPKSMAVSDVVKLMTRILNSEYGIAYNPSPMVLIDRRDRKTLRAECSFQQMGVLDGATLMLI